MKSSIIPVSLASEHRNRRKPCFYILFVTLSAICFVYFVTNAWLGKEYVLVSSALNIEAHDVKEDKSTEKSNENCKHSGSHALPQGIISKISNLDMQPLWGPVSENKKSDEMRVLLAIPVGIKQRSLVVPLVEKFLADDFVVMLFHYDGMVNEWNDLEWSDEVIHVSAKNQAKLWFAKRFLHPDIVAEYEYIFLWDEDLGVENFTPRRYLSIIKKEGLEISQPGLAAGSEVHHQITMRKKRSKVHRRYYDFRGHSKCYDNSTAPPCVGWVEIMAPVFSRAAWRCVWYMIQNDLIHGWGLDKKLGYCAQGDRTAKVGVVDEEYVSHLGVPTLGSLSEKNKTGNEDSEQSSHSNNPASEKLAVPAFDLRHAVRRRSYDEMSIFTDRWNKAVQEDECWEDPFEQSVMNSASEDVLNQVKA